MKRSFIAAVVVMLLGCEDSGRAPFTGSELFNAGGSKPGVGGSGGKGGSGGSGGSGGMPSSGCSPNTCGSSSAVSLPGGGSCYCDSQCASQGDCCGNYESVCLGSGGFGGSAGACSAGQYDSCTTHEQCCGYPDSTLCVNFDTDGTYCTPLCVSPSECTSNCCKATLEGPYVCHPASACGGG